MTYRVTATEASRKFSELLNRVRFGGDSFVIVRGGEEIGTLAPVEQEPNRARSSTLGDLFTALRALPPPDPDFADDLAAIQDLQAPISEGPWGT